MRRGVISEWNDARGFGFIVADDAPDERLFFHARDWRGVDRPGAGERVGFAAARQRDGRACARDVAPRDGVRTRAKRTGNPKPRRRPAAGARRSGAAAWLWTGMVVAAYCTLLGIAVERGRLPLEAAFLPLLLSGIAWIAYALDKRAARHGRWRIPEVHLHLLELAGGWPGALLAQRMLRHKNRKRAYQIVFWLVVAAHTGALAFWAFHA